MTVLSSIPDFFALPDSSAFLASRTLYYSDRSPIKAFRSASVSRLRKKLTWSKIKSLTCGYILILSINFCFFCIRALLGSPPILLIVVISILCLVYLIACFAKLNICFNVDMLKFNWGGSWGASSTSSLFSSVSTTLSDSVPEPDPESLPLSLPLLDSYAFLLLAITLSATLFIHYI